MNKEYIIPDLLSKQLLGSLTPEERDVLDCWIGESEENRALYDRVMREGFIPEKAEQLMQTDIVAGYTGVLEKRRRAVLRRRIIRWTSVAAAALIPLAAFLLWNFSRGGADRPVSQVAAIKPGEQKAELILSDGTSYFLGHQIKEALLLEKGAGIHLNEKIINYTNDIPTEELHYNTLRVPRGGEFSLKLHDGTYVHLNSESELRYPVTFTGSERKVYLTGEAYFEVAEDPEHPFVVNLPGDATVRVLGTAFNISAYADDDAMLTTLVQGSVAMAVGNEGVILRPGEQAYLSDGDIEIRKTDTYIYTAWKDGVFAFRQQSLESIMKIIARWYDVNVFWENSSPREITFTGKVRRYEDFSKVVEMLEHTGEIEFQIKDKTIVIREKR